MSLFIGLTKEQFKNKIDGRSNVRSKRYQKGLIKERMDTTPPDTTPPDTTTPDASTPDTTTPDATSPDTTPPAPTDLTYNDLMDIIKDALNIVYNMENEFKDTVTSATYAKATAQMISSNKFTTNGGIVVGSHDNMIRAVQTNTAIQTLKFSFYNEYLVNNESPLESKAIAAELSGMYEDSIKEFTEPKSMLEYVDIFNVDWCEVDEENKIIKYKRTLTETEEEQNKHAKTEEDKIPTEGAVSFEQIYDRIAHDFIINCNIDVENVRKKITNYYNNVTASLQLYQLNLIEIVGQHENLVFEQSNKAVQKLSLEFEQRLKRIYDGIGSVQLELIHKQHQDQMQEMEQQAEQIQEEAEKRFEEADKRFEEGHVDSPLYKDGVYVGPVEEQPAEEPKADEPHVEEQPENKNNEEVELDEYRNIKIVLYIIASIVSVLLFSYIIYAIYKRSTVKNNIFTQYIPNTTSFN